MTTTSKILDQNAVKAAVAKLANEHEKLRKTLKDSMTGVNALIEQKTAELRKLIMSVSIDDATKLLMDRLRDDVRHHQATQYAADKILTARRLTCFGAIERPAGFSGSGNLDFSRDATKTPALLEYDAKAHDLLALCPELFFPAIEQTVRQVLKDAGCPETGPGTDELLAQARAMSAELQSLEMQRREFRDQFAMTSTEDQPLGYQEFMNRKDGGVIQPRTEPSVTRADKQQMEFGHSRMEALRLASDPMEEIESEVKKENAHWKAQGKV